MTKIVPFAEAAAALKITQGELAHWIARGCPVARGAATLDRIEIDVTAAAAWRKGANLVEARPAAARADKGGTTTRPGGADHDAGGGTKRARGAKQEG
ncbi:MAG TPA: hypothetical protein VLA52_07085 [Thermohalobaculum sp.]|nr:hypothetical protein [Thermohalobaculum sp.]